MLQLSEGRTRSHLIRPADFSERSDVHFAVPMRHGREVAELGEVDDRELVRQLRRNVPSHVGGDVRLLESYV